MLWGYSLCTLRASSNNTDQVSGTIKETSWVVIHPKLRTGLLKYERQIHFLQSLQNQVFPTYTSNNSNSYDCRTFQYPNHKSTQATHYVYTKETLIGSENQIQNLFTNNKSIEVATAESILKMHNDIMIFF